MKPTSIKLSEGMLKELKGAAQAHRRTVSFIIRDSIEFWLAKHRREAAETEELKAGDRISPRHSESGIL
jgi:predicted transcriptional regulator